jgi:hypothetical protein
MCTPAAQRAERLAQNALPTLDLIRLGINGRPISSSVSL